MAQRSRIGRSLAAGILLLMAAAGGAAAQGGTFRFELEPTTPATDRVTVRVVAEEVTDLYGVSFDIRYPHRLVSFVEEEVEEGDLLSEGGEVETVFVVERKAPRTLIVGLTRLGDVEGVDGSGVVLSLVFQARAGTTGRGKLLFQNRDAVDSSGEILDEAKFQNGSLAVARP